MNDERKIVLRVRKGEGVGLIVSSLVGWTKCIEEKKGKMEGKKRSTHGTKTMRVEKRWTTNIGIYVFDGGISNNVAVKVRIRT